MNEPTSVAEDRHEDARNACILLLENGDYAGAIERLAATASLDESGESEALLGVAFFRSERYGEAGAHFDSALKAPNAAVDARAEWAHMLAVCEANAAAEVNVQVPPEHYHQRELLLGPPEKPSLPTPPEPVRIGMATRFHHAVGHALGSIGGMTFSRLSGVFGKKYRDEVWTNWYRKRLSLAILTLAHMRDHLNKNNLFSTYPDDVNIAFQPDPGSEDAPTGATHFRTADGSWNNLENPKEGAAGTRFPRNVAYAAIKPEDGDRLLTPNPRLVSRELLSRGETMKEVPFLNMLAASWIQFMNHDWISHGENQDVRKGPDKLIEIPLAPDDPARLRYRQTNMFVGRTQADPTRGGPGEPIQEPTPVTFINEVTHWWDGSQIYGSDQATQDRLRSGQDGKLKLTADRTLPLGDNKVEDTGMNRNWWVGLAMLHNLFALEHNSICDRLKKHNPDWDDNRLFNVARLVNAALMAKIHSIEWTPAILPNPALAMGLNMNWYGMLTYRFRSPEHRKTLATYNVENPELGGLVGNKLNTHGQPFGLAQEFVEIYRLHSLLPESLRLRRLGDDAEIEDVPFVASRQAGSPKITDKFGMANLFYSFGNQNPGQLVLNNYPKFMQELSLPGNPVFDLGAVDILRARERGVPRYNEFREQLGLNPLRTFDDLTPDAATVARIKEIYDDVEDLDLLVGTLAEGTRPTGFGFGETMFQIFILNASRRLQADRFFTDSYTEEVYTKPGMKWIDDTTFKDVILRHYPELADTGLDNVKNAFEPWDTGSVLWPQRHPLRGCDPDLKKDPWRGESDKK